MANDVLAAYGSSTDITITMNSITNAAARQSTAVTDVSPSIPRYRIFYKVTTGTSPTLNSRFDFYVARGDDNGTEFREGSVGSTDAAYTGDLNQLEQVGSQVVTASSNTTYYGSFVIEDPGTDWVIVFSNQTGVTSHATAGNFGMRYRAINDQIQ